ncbi:MAG: hypothetical protein KDC52_00995, partial [Ignavibacteriae bacterium]|nr:hypothetical protein [Ignavibacteriota bacterium]
TSQIRPALCGILKPNLRLTQTDEMKIKTANASKNKRGATLRSIPTLLHHICFCPNRHYQTNSE